MTPRNSWLNLLEIADRDRDAFRVLVDSQFPLAFCCFHAQQAVEKYFKAILRSREIDYNYTHDLLILMEILKENGFILPFPQEQVEKLNPFAVQARYDLPAVITVESKEIEEIVDLVADWCKKQLHD